MDEAIAALDSAKETAREEATAQLQGLLDKWEQAEEMIPNLEESLNANTMGLGYDLYAAQMQSTLSEIEGNIEKLDAAMNELYQGNLTAAIEFANAQTTISLGELQLNPSWKQEKSRLNPGKNS